MIRACRRETCGSFRTTSFAGLRPIVTSPSSGERQPACGPLSTASSWRGGGGGTEDDRARAGPAAESRSEFGEELSPLRLELFTMRNQSRKVAGMDGDDIGVAGRRFV